MSENINDLPGEFSEAKKRVEKDMPGDLTLEQKFQLQRIANEVQHLDLEQAQAYIVELSRQLMIKKNLFKHWAKNESFLIF